MSLRPPRRWLAPSRPCRRQSSRSRCWLHRTPGRRAGCHRENGRTVSQVPVQQPNLQRIRGSRVPRRLRHWRAGLLRPPRKPIRGRNHHQRQTIPIQIRFYFSYLPWLRSENANSTCKPKSETGSQNPAQAIKIAGSFPAPGDKSAGTQNRLTLYHKLTAWQAVANPHEARIPCAQYLHLARQKIIGATVFQDSVVGAWNPCGT